MTFLTGILPRSIGTCDVAGHRTPDVDVIFLSYAKTYRELELTRNAISTLVASDIDITFRIVVVETASREHLSALTNGELFGPNVTVAFPTRTFNYNEFLQCGFRAIEQSSSGVSPYVLISNNDVRFEKGCAKALISELGTYDSTSPWCPGYHDQFFKGDAAVYEGYRSSLEVCGWAIMWRRALLDHVSFAELFPANFAFWFQDDYYGFQLQRLGLKHGLVRRARVHHLFCQSHSLIDPDRYHQLTDGSYGEFMATTAGVVSADDKVDKLTVVVQGRLANDGVSCSLRRLLTALACQIRSLPVELIAIVDNGHRCSMDLLRDACSVAKGAYVAVLHSDDEISANFVSDLVAVLDDTYPGDAVLQSETGDDGAVIDRLVCVRADRLRNGHKKALNVHVFSNWEMLTPNDLAQLQLIRV